MSDGASSNSPKADAPTLDFKRLTADCSRAAFSCGESDIDKWFRKKALSHHDRMQCRVVTGHLGGNTAPVGFYAMRMKLESVSDLPKEFRPSFSFTDDKFPALHLQYLAVQRIMQRKEFGTVLMGALVEDFYEVATRASIVALTVVAIDVKTAEFYRKLGFVDFGPKGISQPNLFLPAASVIEVREKSGV